MQQSLPVKVAFAFLALGSLLLVFGNLAEKSAGFTLVITGAMATVLSVSWRAQNRRVDGLELILLRHPLPRQVEVEEDIDSNPIVARIRSNLNCIVGERHLRYSPDAHNAAGTFVSETLNRHGWSIEKQPVVAPYGIGANFIARNVGARNEDRTWIVGAHYDTVRGTPGADDNSIAVAALLYLAEAWSGVTFSDNVQLVAWDQEEVQTRWSGGLLGSKTMARSLKSSRGNIGGVVVLEMIGMSLQSPHAQRQPAGFGWLFSQQRQQLEQRQWRADFIAAVGNRSADALCQELNETAVGMGLPFLHFPVGWAAARLSCTLRRSDHAPFWDLGVPAVMLTDTGEFRGGFYHTPLDVSQNLDFDFAARVTDTVKQTIERLAGRIS
jgi:Zn-dependent M28 family amino/carboxypeptidase